MLDTNVPSKLNLSLETYKDKVLGCWTGKNIGGTLGAPFEGKREMNDVDFYVQDLKGSPAPNDDLDLQLVWLQAAENHGLYNLSPRLLGEYWMNFIAGPWNEYGVCKANIANGLYPPLSGSCDNEVWKFSNGAWIRSEIWACLFPGSPDEAAEFAYIDACCDHYGEGVYAELFTCALEAAAFVVSDIRKLIEIALSKIPSDCRVARSVKLAAKLFDGGEEFKAAREEIVKDSEDLGWFQAPANIGFAVLGLLYGRGDFERSVCLANNCGDDTDCTAATVGATLGIVYGRSGIPKKWTDPIGESVKTVAINTFGLNVPATLDELTSRTVKLALQVRRENPSLIDLSEKPSEIPANYRESLVSSEAVAKRVWSKSPYALTFELPYAKLDVDYQGGPFVKPGERKTLKLEVHNPIAAEGVVHLKLKLPEGWRATPSPSVSLKFYKGCVASIPVTVEAAPTAEALSFIPLEVAMAGRFNVQTLNLPLLVEGAVNCNPIKARGCDQAFYDAQNRRLARSRD